MHSRLDTRRAALAAALCLTGADAGAQDPVTSDPTPRDSAFPAAIEEVALTSGGSRMNGFVLLAQGARPHAVVILLHGFPGNERNLDVAQALRRAGTHVLYFDYRGSWGSGGTFSFANAQADVAAALAWVRAPAQVRRFRIDPARVALIGHSMGGWLSVLGAARDPGVVCIGALESADFGRDAQDASSARELREYTASLTAPGAPLKGNASTMMASLRAHPEWQLPRVAVGVATRPILLLDNEVNPYHDDLVAALRTAGATRLTEMTWDTDHSFNDRRIELTRAVVRWTTNACGF